MKKLLLVGVLMSLAAVGEFGQVGEEAGRTIHLTSKMGEVVVPAGRMWKVERAATLKDEGVSTADLYVAGQMAIGPNKDLSLNGRFDISFNKSPTFPIWIHGGAKVRVGDSRQTLDVSEAFIEPWRKPVPSLGSLASLSSHVGEYPCQTGLLGASVLQTALLSVLSADYGAFLEHMQFSGCGAVAWRGPLLLMDVSQEHVGGYTSLIMVNPKTSKVWLFWLPGTVSDKHWKLYGPQPVPDEVSKLVVDELNSVWGHVASFSWRDGGLVFGPPKAAILASVTSGLR
jgi:hypothetical protein